MAGLASIRGQKLGWKWDGSPYVLTASTYGSIPNCKNRYLRTGPSNPGFLFIIRNKLLRKFDIIQDKALDEPNGQDIQWYTIGMDAVTNE